MRLIKYRPGFPARQFDNFFDDFFNKNVGGALINNQHISTPSVNVVESKEEYKIEVAAPGFEKRDFEVKVEKDTLLITTKKGADNKTAEEGKYTRREFNYSTFTRSFHLPDSVDAASIGAAYNNGILNITIPKVEATKEKEPKLIDIQ